ncbi:MAG: sulfurtransferase [Burkholderiales bacterium]|nr:sulfurtransferase [Burkholderiales bacterium]
MQTLSAPDLAAWLADETLAKPFLLDVREPNEYQYCRIPNAVLMPMQSVPERMSELDEEAPIVCMCHHGVRSMQVARYLEQNGFTNVINLTGGVHAWAQQVDPDMPVY